MNGLYGQVLPSVPVIYLGGTGTRCTVGLGPSPAASAPRCAPPGRNEGAYTNGCGSEFLYYCRIRIRLYQMFGSGYLKYFLYV